MQAATATFQYSHTIGRTEFSGTGFRYPVAMARGEGGLLYVVNRSYEYQPQGKRVTICTVDEEYVGEFGRAITSPGALHIPDEDGALVWPTAIALDGEGNVYVADEWLNRISIFTRDGGWLGKWGTPGEGDGEVNRPSSLAFDGDGDLCLVDSSNNRIQRFTRDGRFLAKWGVAGSGDGEFNLPWGIDIDGEGDVFVADWRNDRIQKFTPDGQFLMKLGSPGTGPGEFNRPSDVAVDGEGLIYVADWGNDRLQVFSPDGGFIAQMTGDATMSKWGKEKLDSNPHMWQEREIAQGMEREKLFWGPIAVEVDAEGRVLVADSCRGRIQVYRKQPKVFLGGRLA